MNSLKYLFGLYLFLLIFTIILCADNNNNNNHVNTNTNKIKTKTINNNNNVRKNVQEKSVSIRSTLNNQQKSLSITKPINSISIEKNVGSTSFLKLNSDVATASSTKINLKTSVTSTTTTKKLQNTTPPPATLKKPATIITASSNSVGVKKKAATTTTVVQNPPKKTTKFDEYLCPKQTEFQWFPQFCNKHTDCKQMGKQFRCCKFNNKRCVRGIQKPIEEPKHSPLLGVIPRRCPKEPLAELFWEVQTCNTDQDCWPRICCPDGRIKYCRTSDPDLNALPFPVAKQIAYPLQSASEYLQCTAPPPPLYDLHPKPCKNTWDCFPNVCCQELGKKHCRPPRRSLLALVAGFAQRFNTGIVKQWTDNLVIK